MAAHLEGDGAIAMAAVAADAPDAPPPPVLESSLPAAAAPKPKPKPKRSSGCCSKPVDDFRDVVILDRDANQGSKFGDNSISTSKYNIFNFLPKSIAEQFKRVANFWLLFMSLVMIIGQYFPQLYHQQLQAHYQHQNAMHTQNLANSLDETNNNQNESTPNFLTCSTKYDCQLSFCSDVSFFGTYWRNKSNSLCGFPTALGMDYMSFQKSNRFQSSFTKRIDVCFKLNKNLLFKYKTIIFK
jgi:hypothetical protein